MKFLSYNLYWKSKEFSLSVSSLFSLFKSSITSSYLHFHYFFKTNKKVLCHVYLSQHFSQLNLYCLIDFYWDTRFVLFQFIIIDIIFLLIRYILESLSIKLSILNSLSRLPRLNYSIKIRSFSSSLFEFALGLLL